MASVKDNGNWESKFLGGGWMRANESRDECVN